MSPVGVRRWRAERLLRKDFEALRARVLTAVRGRLGASAALLAQADLDACYAQAWQGLYAAVLGGQEIANPAGWLVVVTHRRAIDELRAHTRARRAGARHRQEERDLAAELDERARLRALFEALGSLSAKEREAAVLCYLHGLTRAQAAAHMGLSERAFRKLMEGRGGGRPGVAAKVGTLVQAIGEGRWCEQQGSLMRALAYGMLDPQGERYPAALAHSRQCPACRSYVASLRDLATALPPLLLPRGAGAGVLARLLGHAHGGGVAATAGGSGAGATGAGAGATGSGLSGGASAAGAGGVGATGGGWLLAGGSVGAKLAAGCVLALSIGAGCIAVGAGSPGAPRPRQRAHGHIARTTRARSTAAVATSAAAAATQTGPGPGAGASSAALTPAARASREFGLEQPGGVSAGGGERGARARHASIARVASSSAGEVQRAQAREPQPAAPVGAPAASEAQAEREFSPG